jgi:hypothetical protein
VCGAAADVVESLARLQRARHLAAHNDAFRRFAPTASSQLAGKASRKLIAAVVRLASDTADSVATIAAPIAAQLRAPLADSSFLSQAQKLALAHVFELLRGVARHLGRPARRTPGYCTRAASAGAVAPVRVLRRPDSRDEFELALGEAVAAMQLGNCDLVRLRGTSDGGVAVRLCGPALARRRFVHAKRMAPSASTRRTRRPDEAGHGQARA